MRRDQCLLALGLVLALSGAAQAQETFTYYLQQESSDYTFAYHALKAAPPDSPVATYATSIIAGTSTGWKAGGQWLGLPNTPAIKYIPPNTTFTFTFWMRKSAARGVVYPAVKMFLNENDLWVGSAGYEYFLCEQRGTTSALGTTFAEYTLACTSNQPLLLGSLDRLNVWVWYYVDQSPTRDVNAELAIEGTTSPSYPSRVVVSVPANPRITSMTPVVGPTGTTVTIDGANFGTAGQLTFNGVAVTPLSWTSTRITAASPTGSRAIVRVRANSLDSNPWTYIGTWNEALCQPQLSSERLGPIAQSGGSTTLTITAPSTCSWTISSPPAWLTVAPASGSGSATINITASDYSSTNANLAPRVGSFAVNGVPVAVLQRTQAFDGAYMVFSPTPTLTLAQSGQVTCSADLANATNRSVLQGMDIYGDGQLIASAWRSGLDENEGALLQISITPTAYARTFYCVVFSIPDGYVLAQSALTAPGPSLTSISPGSGRVDTTVALDGTGFGAVQGNGFVTFGGVTANVIAWSDTRIYVDVPSALLEGVRTVTVTADGYASNPINFTVLSLADPGGTLSFYHTDAIGSVRMITDGAGQPIARYDYLPFGQDWPSVPPTDPNSVRFAGKERDRETGAESLGWSPLDYFGARDYQSQTGRFTSPDIAGIDQSPLDPQSWNLYSYVRNNPFRFVDPSGRKCENGFNTDTGAFCSGTIRDEDDDAWRAAQRFFLESWWNLQRQLPRTTGFFEGSGQSVVTLVTSPLNSCLALFAGETVRNLSPIPMDSNFSAGEFIKSTADTAAIVAWNQSLRYAASRPNYLGGQGLLNVMKSKVYRKMVGRIGAFGRASVVAQEIYAMAAALASEWEAMDSGQCR